MSRYGSRTASSVVRPNMKSSFEYPKTNASSLSISVTSTSSPTASDNVDASSRPPKPAPRITTRSIARFYLRHASAQLLRDVSAVGHLDRVELEPVLHLAERFDEAGDDTARRLARLEERALQHQDPALPIGL